MTSEIFHRTGALALGSRLRQLTELITNDAGRIDQFYETCLQPKWFPVYYILLAGDNQGITDIARLIGHSHASVITIVKEMTAAGLTRTRQDDKDKRRQLVSLTPKGRRLAPAIELMCRDVQSAVGQIDAETTQHLWQAIGEWEQKLQEKSLFDRVVDMKVKRENDEVQIVDYDDSKHHEPFKQLNEQWIKALFHIEQEDLDELEHPMENIINKGGFIYIAEYKGEAVGCFAAMPCEREGYDLELVKFAVNPKIQGKGIGRRLIEACLRKARMLGCRKLFLETNKRCEAAVHLYEEYGFKHLPVGASNYERADVQMENILY